jgi:uroporphyrinogen-III synthase
MQTSIRSRKLPLAGMRVLVGRARHQASKLSAGLRGLGAEVIEIPFIEIRRPKSYTSLDSALRNIQKYDWLILTSVNGVDAVWERLRKVGLTRRHLRHMRFAAIGPATKQAIEGRGVKVSVVPKEYVAESVVKSLGARVKGKRVLLARAKVARDVIPRELRKLGAEVDVVEAYQTVLPRSSGRRLRSVLVNSKGRPDVITFTSSSSVRNFVSLLDDPHPFAHNTKEWGTPNRQPPHPFAENAKGWGTRYADLLDCIQFASIGPVTSSTLREFGLPVHIQAREYTIPGLIGAIERSLVRR